jgi:hypothetical protein
MTEQELRALVRDVIAKQAATRVTEASPFMAAPARLHASHVLFSLPAGADGDGSCIIEPAVACNHCGYCKSLGH